MNYLRSWESLRCALSFLVKTKGVFISCSNANKRQPPFSVLCTQEYLHCFLSIKLTTIPTCKLFLTLYNCHNCYALFSASTSVSHFILFFNTSVTSTSRLISRNAKEEHKIVKQKRVTKATAKIIGLTFLYQRRLRARNCTTQRFSYLALDTDFIISRPYKGFCCLKVQLSIALFPHCLMTFYGKKISFTNFWAPFRKILEEFSGFSADRNSSGVPSWSCPYNTSYYNELKSRCIFFL